MDQTQNNGGTAATATPSSGGAPSAGQASNQPAGNQGVDSGQAAVDTRNNPGAGDGSNGSDNGGSGRQRPTRIERRLGKLSGELRSKEAIEAENQRLRQMLQQTPDYSGVKLPDYSDRDQITPDELKKDIISAADQIVSIRMSQIVPEVRRGLSQQQLNERAVADIESSSKAHPELDSDSEQYDPDLDQYLADTFAKAYAGDAQYRFADLVEQTFKIRGSVNRTSNDANDTKQTNDNRSRGAIRDSGGGSTKGHKAVSDMTSAEYLAYVKAGGKETA